MAERVGQTLGNYHLLRLLGRGAFAEVYLAEHRYLEVPAAIKVLHVHMEPETQEQFQREARTIAHLKHPHILGVHDFGFQDQTPYLVMEYSPNGTLRTRHPKGTRLPLEQIVAYVKQIALALDYAHQQRVIHRDVKPENLLLTANDEVVLSDFGIAVVQHSLDSLSTQSQAGTPSYMAPEQIEGHPCAASDQYALGVVVYEWLCGARPFEGSLIEVMVQHLTMPPPPLHEKGATIPAELEQVVLRALAKDPKARFASVQDFADVLQEVGDATQRLSVRVSSERLSPEQIPPPDILAGLRHEPSPQEQARSPSTTQPLVLTRQHTAEREESVALEMPPPVSQIHTRSQQRGVAVSRTNRQRFLRKVRAFWISGVLEHSLHGAALIALGLQEQPDAVANPWQLVLQHPAGVPRSLPAGTRITEVYDAAEGELLILGAPGSGKSTLLLELARDLLSRAEQDERHPLPAVFNLSSWASKQHPLADWLVEELNSTYQVPRKLGHAWVETDQILPLLDGLDEVAPKERTACIEAINTYRGEHGFLPMVVCSRSADYLARVARVRLGSAVAVQPLTEQQVNDYLASGGEPLWTLRVALQEDASLRELTSSPLMLSILTLTYHDVPLEDLLRGGIAPTYQQIFAHYVERMLKHRGAAMRYTAEQTMHWLAWLARQMMAHHQSEVYLEQFQPDWLPKRQRAFYQWSVGLVAGLVVGLVAGLAAGLVANMSFGLFVGLFAGLVGGMSFGLSVGLSTKIEPAEALTWSWKRLLAGQVFWTVFGLVFVLLVFVLVFVPLVGVGWLLVVLVFVLLVFGLVSGFSRKQLTERFMLSPNEGIRRSIKNGLVFELGGLVFGLFLGLLAGQVFGLGGLVFGLGGLVFGLVFGLGAAVQHYTLRFWLWQARCTPVPWRYVAFLDDTVEQLLLRKVGGGYIFQHRLLLEYFASLDNTPPRNEAREQK